MTRNSRRFHSRSIARERRRRSGMSLLHLTIAIGISSILIGFSGVFISRVIDAERAVRREAMWTSTAMQLDEWIRIDVHSCLSTELGADDVSLRMYDGGVVSYVWDSTEDKHTMRRREWNRQGKIVSQESFVLPPNSMSRWTKSVGRNGMQFVRMQIEQSSDSRSSKHLFDVVAKMGGVNADDSSASSVEVTQ